MSHPRHFPWIYHQFIGVRWSSPSTTIIIWRHLKYTHNVRHWWLFDILLYVSFYIYLVLPDDFLRVYWVNFCPFSFVLFSFCYFTDWILECIVINVSYIYQICVVLTLSLKFLDWVGLRLMFFEFYSHLIVTK